MRKIPIHDNIINAMIAVAIDTDGSIFMYEHKHGNNQKSSIGTNITVTNNSVKFLEKMNEYMGYGTIKSHGNRKTRILLVENQSNLVDLLERIIPYLIIKKKQGLLMLTYCLGRLDKSGPYTEKEWLMIKEMSKLNNRGV